MCVRLGRPTSTNQNSRQRSAVEWTSLSLIIGPLLSGASSISCAFWPEYEPAAHEASLRTMWGVAHRRRQAWICSYECTFCFSCTEKMRGRCPNCEATLPDVRVGASRRSRCSRKHSVADPSDRLGASPGGDCDDPLVAAAQCVFIDPATACWPRAAGSTGRSCRRPRTRRGRSSAFTSGRRAMRALRRRGTCRSPRAASASPTARAWSPRRRGILAATGGQHEDHQRRRYALRSLRPRAPHASPLRLSPIMWAA
jgi:hypothetical protein